MKNIYFIEVTDTFGGEANYSWVTRHVIAASTMRGAISKFSRLSGISWRYEYGNENDVMRYNSKSGATCYFIQTYSDEDHAQYHFDTDERN